jgi:hypothetical protein
VLTTHPLANTYIGNLELWSSWQPSGQRIEDKVAWAKALLSIYEPNALAEISI